MMLLKFEKNETHRDKTCRTTPPIAPPHLTPAPQRSLRRTRRTGVPPPRLHEMADSSYSFSLTTFSPSGKLGQIEHALKAVQAGKTSLGIQGAAGALRRIAARCHSLRALKPPLPQPESATNGVVIATEKKLPSTLVDETSVEKISLFTSNIGVVYSGMGPDFRVLVCVENGVPEPTLSLSQRQRLGLHRRPPLTPSLSSPRPTFSAPLAPRARPVARARRRRLSTNSCTASRSPCCSWCARSRP